MSGQWPPEWEDEEEFPEGEDQPDAATQARLSEVTAYLASVPAPVLPDDVEARISAALAAEAAGPRTPGSAASEPTLGPSPEPTLGPAPGRAHVRRRSGGGPRHRRDRSAGDGRRRRRGAWSLSAVAVVCLLLVGLGYGLSLGSGSSSSSSSAASGAFSEGSASSSSRGEAPAALPAEGHSFVVTQSGTEYQAGTLAIQVRAKLAGVAAKASQQSGVNAPVPTGTTPNLTLSGCVLQLTGGATPSLVDRATYQGEPAYIIADSKRVWVVGLGCTAVKSDLIASVPLTG